MGKGRLEAFSDGVLAIIITIMVLELKVPHGYDFSSLQPLLPVFLSYVLSFIYLAIYWNNHHHMLHTCQHVSGRILASFFELRISHALYVLVAIMWLVPDRRIEHAMQDEHTTGAKKTKAQP